MPTGSPNADTPVSPGYLVDQRNPLRRPPTDAERATAYATNAVQRAFQTDSRGAVILSESRREETFTRAIDKAPESIKDEVKKQLAGFLTKEKELKPAAAKEPVAPKPAEREYAYIDQGSKQSVPFSKAEQFIQRNYESLQRELRGDKKLGNTAEDREELFQAALKRAKDPETRELLEERLALTQVDIAEKNERLAGPARAPQATSNTQTVENAARQLEKQAHLALALEKKQTLEPTIQNRTEVLQSAINLATDKAVKEKLEEKLNKVLQENDDRKPAAVERPNNVPPQLAESRNDSASARSPQAASARAAGLSPIGIEAEYLRVINEAHEKLVRINGKPLEKNLENRAAILIEAGPLASNQEVRDKISDNLAKTLETADKQRSNRGAQASGPLTYNSNDKEAAGKLVNEIVKETYGPNQKTPTWKELSQDDRLNALLDAKVVADKTNQTGVSNFLSLKLNEEFSKGQPELAQDQRQRDPLPSTTLDERSRAPRGR